MKKTEIEEAMKFRHPEIVVNVVTKSKEAKIDVTPIGWAMLGSSNPRTWAIGIAKKHYSHKAILDSKEFTINIPSFEQRVDTLYCGRVSGWDEDKLSKTNFKTIDSKSISVPILEDSLASFECKLINQMETSDHTIFLGEILNAYISGGNDGLINVGHSTLARFERGKK